jgi:hypothetical protein
MSGNCYPGHLFLIARRMLHRITLRLPNKRGQLRARLSELGCRLNRVETTVKNGPDALKMGCLFYPPRKQTSVSFAATVIGGMTKQTGKAKIYARCRTFVPSTWLNADQQFLPRAVDVEQTVATDLWHWDKIGEVLPVLLA